METVDEINSPEDFSDIDRIAAGCGDKRNILVFKISGDMLYVRKACLFADVQRPYDVGGGD